MTTDNPGIDLSAALRAWQPGSLDPGYADTKITPSWVRICICGHREVSHDRENGGTRKINQAPWTVRFPPCTGPVFRGSSSPKLNPLFDKSVDNGEPVTAYAVKCFCEQFTPIAEVDRPSVAFKRMPHPDDHAFIAGIRAFQMLFRNRGVQDPTAPAREKRRIPPTEQQVNEFIDSRVRWILDGDQRRCSSCGVTAIEQPVIFPVYSGLPLGKVSEFRCTACRPSA